MTTGSEGDGTTGHDHFAPFGDPGIADDIERSHKNDDGSHAADDHFGGMDAPGETEAGASDHAHVQLLFGDFDASVPVGSVESAGAAADVWSGLPSPPLGSNHVSIHAAAPEEEDLFGAFGGPSDDVTSKNECEAFPAEVEEDVHEREPSGDGAGSKEDTEEKKLDCDNTSQAKDSGAVGNGVELNENSEQFATHVPTATEDRLENKDEDFGTFEGVDATPSANEASGGDAMLQNNVDDFGEWDCAFRDEPLFQAPNSAEAVETSSHHDDASQKNNHASKLDMDAPEVPNEPATSENVPHFAANSPTVAENLIENSDEDFGTFESTDTTPALLRKKCDTLSEDAPVSQELNFSEAAETLVDCDDDTSPSVKTGSPEVLDEAAPSKNSEQFEASFSAMAEDPIEKNDDGFDAFEGVDTPEEAAPSKNSEQFEASFPAVAEDHIEEKDDDFGNFEGVDAPEEAAPSKSPEHFEASFPVVAEELFENNDEDFGTLEGADTLDQAAPSTNSEQLEASFPVVAGNPMENNNEDFGNFEGVDALKNASSKITPSVNNLDDNFGNFSSFDDAPVAQEKKSSDEKTDLQFILRSSLGEEYGKLPFLWKTICKEVENDLQRGNKAMDYLSKSLSFKDRAIITKSKKLWDYIFGLTEFVRVIRSISSTIGELIGVSKTIDVQESTITKWNYNDIISNAIIIESLWSDIISKALMLEIISRTPQLESVVEIRARGGLSLRSDFQKSNSCQITLQPFDAEETGCTQSPVVWNNKKCMACAANLCANRNHLSSMV